MSIARPGCTLSRSDCNGSAVCRFNRVLVEDALPSRSASAGGNTLAQEYHDGVPVAPLAKGARDQPDRTTITFWPNDKSS